jgi:hypothetical protein
MDRNVESGDRDAAGACKVSGKKGEGMDPLLDPNGPHDIPLPRRRLH